MLTTPTFSVCLPVFNRGTTIYQALESVAKQTFRDFEVIVVDCQSSDNSRSEIDRFFNSTLFKERPFPYIYQTRDYAPVTVEDWNEPVLLATGRYIAMLEGDDQFADPQHLERANQIFIQHPDLGVYACGSQRRKRSNLGLFSPTQFSLIIYRAEEVPPPSEAIFRRLDSCGKPFLYNSTLYEYSPESDLYLQIAFDKLGAYYDTYQSIFRGPSTSIANTWHFFVDCFTLAEQYRAHFTDKEYLYLQNFTARRVIAATIRAPRSVARVNLTKLRGVIGLRRLIANTTVFICKGVKKRILRCL